jgi:hypothetical protein
LECGRNHPRGRRFGGRHHRQNFKRHRGASDCCGGYDDDIDERTDAVELIMLIGIPATGKSSFYKARLADTHVRVNGDMLRGNRGCETDLIEACLRHGQPLCIDKVNYLWLKPGACA